MDPQPFSQGNYELNEKCDNHDDRWCLFYWSLFVCTGHRQGPRRGASERDCCSVHISWLTVPQSTHGLVGFVGGGGKIIKAIEQKKDMKPWDGGPETDVVSPPFCAADQKTSYLVHTETKTCKLPQLISFSCHQLVPSSPFMTPEFQNKVLLTAPSSYSYLTSRTSALACLLVPLTTTFWVPTHASLPSGGPECGDWSATSPHPHIHLWGDWNKSELLSGSRPPCNWILPCFTECNKA